MAQQPAQRGAVKPSTVFHSIADVLKFPDPQWLIESILVKNSFAVLYGPAGVGKSFLALAWGAAVATGRTWHDRHVRGGPVVYVAAEGGGGLKLRIRALGVRHGCLDNVPYWFVTEPVNFMDSNAVTAFITGIAKVAEKPAFIIIDTLARCFVGGDENSAKDMGIFINGVETVRRKTGATVLVIHHTGKNERSGERGSSALRGAADTTISCSGDMGLLLLRCEKQKDAESFPQLTVKLATVDLGEGRSSCVLEPFEASQATKSPDSDTTAKKVLAALEKFGPEGATATEWERACKDIGVSRETFFRRRKKLEQGGLVGKDGDGQGARYRPAQSEPVSVSN